MLAALRELFKAKLGNCPSSDFSSGELVGNMRLHQIEGDQRIDVQTPTNDGMTKECMNEEVDKTPSEHASLVGLNDPADEFFDVPEPSDYDQLENGWSSDFDPEMYSQVPFITKYFPLLTFILVGFATYCNISTVMLYVLSISGEATAANFDTFP